MNDSASLLTPIHGISLYDYAAMCMKLTSGIDKSQILATMGIDEVVWGEVSTLWVKRMQEDRNFVVTTQFGQYFNEADAHPKLGALQAAMNPEAQQNLQRLRSDRYFYEELNGARAAAYEYGLDGAQWIQDTFGINLGDFQAAAMHWLKVQNTELNEQNSSSTHHFIMHQQAMREQYARHFAAEQGGNVADDIEF